MTIRNNVVTYNPATLCCAKKRRCESSGITSRVCSHYTGSFSWRHDKLYTHIRYSVNKALDQFKNREIAWQTFEWKSIFCPERLVQPGDPNEALAKMPLSTTVIGSFPKPVYLKIPDWFRTTHAGPFAEQHNLFLQQSSECEREEAIKRETKEIVGIQTEAGIDVITDGEIRRESYNRHFWRGLNGFDFHNLFSKVCRDGAITTDVPRIVGEVSLRQGDPWVWKEWRASQDLASVPMKITLPGPMTIINSTEDQFYGDEKVLGRVLARIINNEIQAVLHAGCKYIQV